MNAKQNSNCFVGSVSGRAFAAGTFACLLNKRRRTWKRRRLARDDFLKNNEVRKLGRTFLNSDMWRYSKLAKKNKILFIYRYLIKRL